MKRYTFYQNNSGGHFVGPHYFVCLSQDENTAWDILKQQPWYTDEYCECCGPRWMSDFLDWESDPTHINEAIQYATTGEVVDLTKENVNG